MHANTGWGQQGLLAVSSKYTKKPTVKRVPGKDTLSPNQDLVAFYEESQGLQSWWGGFCMGEPG